MYNTHFSVGATAGHMCEFFMYPNDFRYGLFKEPQYPKNGYIQFVNNLRFVVALAEDLEEKFPHVPRPNTFANLHYSQA
jgi:hypothetical protein